MGSTNYKEMASDGQPLSITERATKIRRVAILPSVSVVRYDDVWNKFLQWKDSQTEDHSVPNEEMLLVYFDYLSDQYTSSSMWTMYSMIKKQMLVSLVYFILFIFR